jgi:hypothetical protein
MKYSLAALVALASASTTLAVTLGTAPAVTFALTASSTAGGFKVVDPDTGDTSYEESKTTEGKPDKNGNILTTTEYKTVVQTVKYGNAELLNGLREDGSLPDGTVKGWSIVSAKGLEDEDSQLYAVKKGQVPVLIDDGTEEAVVSVGTIAMTLSGKSTFSSESPDVETTLSKTISAKANVQLSYNGFSVQGIETLSAKYTKGKFGKGADANTYETLLTGAVKMASISGNYFSEEAGIDALVEGSFSIAAEAVLDLETLGFSGQ